MTDCAVADIEKRRELTDTEFSLSDVKYTNDLVPRFVGECRHRADILVESRSTCGRIQILEFGQSLGYLFVTTPATFVGEISL